MSNAYSIKYSVDRGSRLPVWVLTCPPVHSEGMIAYLRKSGCKFHMVMSRRKWERRHQFDFDTFYIETIPQQIVDRLIASTQSKGGRVSLMPNEKLAPLDDSDMPVNPIALYWAALNDGRIETLEKLWKDIEWSPEEGEESETYEQCLNLTAQEDEDALPIF